MSSKTLQSFCGPTLFPQLPTWVYQGLTFHYRCNLKRGSVLRRVYIEKIPLGCLYLKSQLRALRRREEVKWVRDERVPGESLNKEIENIDGALCGPKAQWRLSSMTGS